MQQGERQGKNKKKRRPVYVHRVFKYRQPNPAIHPVAKFIYELIEKNKIGFATIGRRVGISRDALYDHLDKGAFKLPDAEALLNIFGYRLIAIREKEAKNFHPDDILSWRGLGMHRTNRGNKK